MDRRVLGGAAVLLVALAVIGAWRWQSGGGILVRLEATTTAALPGPAAWSGVTLRVRSIVGDVTVVGDPDTDAVTAEIVRVAGGRTPEHVEEILATTVPSLRWSDDRSTVFAETPQIPMLDGGELATTWRITVPAAIAVDVRTDVGAVRVEGLTGDADVRTDVGDITVVQGTGTVTAVADVGDVDVTTTGAATGRTDSGRVLINGVEQAPRD